MLLSTFLYVFGSSFLAFTLCIVKQKQKEKQEVTPVPVSGTMSQHALSVVGSLASAILLLLLGR